MIDILGPSSATCDKISRRTLLRVGALGFAGLSMPNLLRQRALAAGVGPRKDTAVILVWMGGGPSHIDTYDLKPSAPLEFRGDFKPIPTNVSGIQICEHLPLQAKVMDKMAIVRSVTHNDAGHGSASHTLLTGWTAPGGVIDNLAPSMGSVVAKLRGGRVEGIPPYVALSEKEAPFSKAAYLGPSYNPFSPGGDPNLPDFQVRNLGLPATVDHRRLNDRHALRKELDTIRRDLDTQGTAQSLDKFYLDALEMITNPKARDAFAIDKESVRLRDQYGRNTWGQSALMARRLVEAGVTFVTVYMNGWDTHSDNFKGLKNKQLPKYDQAISALVSDLYDRGMHERVLVVACGEFGRTPRIDAGQSGRGHWPGAMSVLFAGGGLQMGQVIGTTDAHAEYPDTRPLAPNDVLATLYQVAGVDHRHVFYDEAKRPKMVLADGEPIRELVG